MRKKIVMNWPNDTDGDVFRSLEKSNFNFEKEYEIDINIDFDHWPLSESEITEIQKLYPNGEIINPAPGKDIGNGKDIGFVQFQIFSKLDYNFIIEVQKSVTMKVSHMGGWCDSWGVGEW